MSMQAEGGWQRLLQLAPLLIVVSSGLVLYHVLSGKPR